MNVAAFTSSWSSTGDTRSLVPTEDDCRAGRSLTFALLDSGLGLPNPYLSRSLVEARDFTGLGLGFQATGHGASLASVLVGCGPDYLGLCPGAPLLYARVLGHAAHERTAAAVVHALRWASQSADIIILAFGSWKGSRRMAAAIQEVALAGKVVVAAAGRSPHGTAFPARLPWVVAIGPLGNDGRPLAGHAAGTDVNYLAPGLKIPVRSPGPSLYSGSSVAAAVAAPAVPRAESSTLMTA